MILNITIRGFVKPILTIILVGAVFFSSAQNLTELIKLNQVGFYPQAQKIAIVESTKATEFYILSLGDNTKVFSGRLSDVRKSEFSEKTMTVADFTTFTKTGSYVVVVSELGKSYPFEIKPDVHDAVSKASIKGFYLQRVSTSLPEKYAGKWKRALGHPDNKVFVHPSAATDKRPEATILSSPRGWYDAGDYNKYIVNSGITMGTLLSAYEDFSTYYDHQKLAIPESDNGLPDLLDEIIWNLRWMLTMQDPNDGGVYHKLTNASFDAFIMPDKATAKRYVVQKGTAAALDFAAVAAQASRVLHRYETILPGLSDSCLVAAKQAWNWALKNPNVIYNQDAINKQFTPKISTGAYGDNNFTDEVAWAASELYATTNDITYLNSVNVLPDHSVSIPSWNQVHMLGYYTLIRSARNLPSSSTTNLATMKKQIVALADKLIERVENRSYRTVMGGSVNDFIWGSSSVAANQGIVLVQAYHITKDKKYLDGALTNVDYLLGRNGTGYSFVTGSGDKPPMHIHHRPSQADGITEPVPGLLSGGPNPGKQDRCSYSTSVPNEAFTDDVCSYASNEIAINWNAPLVYLVGAIEALQKEAGYSE